jgi:hypothetical protein
MTLWKGFNDDSDNIIIGVGTFICLIHEHLESVSIFGTWNIRPGKHSCVRERGIYFLLWIISGNLLFQLYQVQPGYSAL